MTHPRKPTALVLLRIILIIALTEFIIMEGLALIPHPVAEEHISIFDVLALVLISTPIIYYFAIRPFILARNAALERISEMAYRDPLTGLANRRLLSEHLDKCLANYPRTQIYSSLLFVDLDKFKDVNDTYGHDIGDEVLAEVARRLQFATRAGDTVSRLGGDEFLLLIQQMDSSKERTKALAIQLAEKLRNLIEKPIVVHRTTITISASIGIRILDDEELTKEVAIRDADIAMYRAKHSDEQRYCVYGI